MNSNDAMLQSTYTLHLQHPFNWRPIWNSVEHPAVELFCRISLRLKAAGYFCGRAPTWMLDRILNTTLPNNLIIARIKSEEKLSTNGIKQRNLVFTLVPNFRD